jgi:hypothetical protein
VRWESSGGEVVRKGGEKRGNIVHGLDRPAFLYATWSIPRTASEPTTSACQVTRVGRCRQDFALPVGSGTEKMASRSSAERDERESLMRPGEMNQKSAAVLLPDTASAFFYVCIAISSLPSFMCGFSVGFSSPTTVASYTGSGGATDSSACVFYK